MKEHIKVYTGTSILANRLAFLLDEAKIPSLIKDSKESGRLAGFGSTGDSSELFIYKSDNEKSKEIINNFKKELE
ncbi:putative signal transducing protein [Tenacibaculum salmonis]|uniref:putative signal transducing protein n=1 Tax=Tenacibaculum sp. P3-BQ1 TaxID=3232310 RepID=UPI0034DF6051